MTSFWDSVLAEGHACDRRCETTNGVPEGEVGAIQGVFQALMYFESGIKMWWFKGKVGVKRLCHVHYITYNSGYILVNTRKMHLKRFHPGSCLKCSLLSLTDGSIPTRVSALLAETEVRSRAVEWFILCSLYRVTPRWGRNVCMLATPQMLDKTKHDRKFWIYSHMEAPDGKSLR